MHPSCIISQEQHSIWSWFLGHLCKMISPDVSHFFKILIFQVFRGVKGLKMVQNDKKICLSHSISQKPYIIWLSFMVHMCKMISPGFFGFFYFFQKFDFSGCWEKGWGGVKVQKMYHTSYDCYLWYTCVFLQF